MNGKKNSQAYIPRLQNKGAYIFVIYLMTDETKNGMEKEISGRRGNSKNLILTTKNLMNCCSFLTCSPNI